MKRLFFVALLALGLLVLAAPAPARAQEPTVEPTQTPTPAYLQEKPLSSGNTLLIERSVSYGDIAVVTGILILWVTYLATQFIKVPRELLK